MSRSKTLQFLRSSSKWKEILTLFPTSSTKPRADNVAKRSERIQLASFLSTVKETRAEFLRRLCSTNSSEKRADATDQPPGKSDSHGEHPQMTEQSDTKEQTTFNTKSSEGDTNKGHADQANEIKEETKQNPQASHAGNDNMASDRSTLVEEDIKKQLKRLTDMLDGYSSTGKGQEAFQFHKQLFRQGSLFMALDWIMEPLKLVESICNWFYERMIQNVMDFKFDVEEFLDGAKDAFYIVNHLFEEGDYETLKPMVSTKLFESMKTTTQEFQKEGLQFTMTPENILGAYVSGLKIVQANSLMSFGPEFDVPKAEDEKENFWILINVRFIRNDHYKLFRSTGEVLEDRVSRRRDLWTFVRGPITELPMKEDSPSWTVLCIA